MKPDTKQIPGLFPARYVYTWSTSGSCAEAAKLGAPSRTSVEVLGMGGVVTLMGSLDGESWSPLKSKEGDLYRFSTPGIYPVDTSVLHVFPVIPEDFKGSVKVMVI